MRARGVHAAQAPYLQRAVRMIVPYPPAGAGDIAGRMLSTRLTESFGQQGVDFVQQLESEGAEPVGNSPDELQKLVQAEIAQWTRLVKQAKITAD